MDNWKLVTKELPQEGLTVWVYDVMTGYVTLACLVYDGGWMWAISNGVIYSDGRMIVSECELDDDYSFTHWKNLPKLPKKIENK